MTDRELAVNWIRSQGWNEENLPSDELLQMEQAFLAGLKAGKENAKKEIEEGFLKCYQGYPEKEVDHD